MKTIYRLLFFFFFFSLMTCDKEPKMSITACGEHNPNWLINEIDYITKKASNFRPVSVFALSSKVDNIEYIAITDNTNSSLTDALIFYTCAGEKINAGSDKYKELKDAFEAKMFNLLWSN